MHFTRIRLRNWKNFREVDIDLPLRAFLIGPNASGKSNFLDVFRFLHDLVPSRGLQKAVEERGGIQKLRCLHARVRPNVEILVDIVDDDGESWSYQIAFTQRGTFPRQGIPIISKEVVIKGNKTIISRPDTDDEQDQRLLEQTSLEQISRNREFRIVADYFDQVSYLHLVPQMIRNSRGLQFDHNSPDVYGVRFLETVAKTSESRRRRFLGKIEDVLKIAVPQLEELSLVRDSRGIPHLEAKYRHWRPNAGRQDENQFSDGTLRLIGLLWALQDGNGLLLMEEPELSLHFGIITQLASFIHRAMTRNKIQRQTFISTHSPDLLSDEGIGLEEILIFEPNANGTEIKKATQRQDIVRLMNEGLNAGELVLPTTKSNHFDQLRLFDL
jgi:predicted ATPase